ncbi:hypothetical protein [Schleiferilactobacillus harbinensis]|uniref:Uncharacterized protein n=1 Tax=Schleiferilactobacillus harbinensis TaxID=304207 RepID=A0A5P8M3L3_9LACO|nr:hypothetical protein [Schleiferilactobacillus harbinensis]QFR23080.1 hypothetical protein D1010_06480 [Schleiferilactobacillus harbinensis]
MANDKVSLKGFKEDRFHILVEMLMEVQGKITAVADDITFLVHQVTDADEDSSASVVQKLDVIKDRGVQMKAWARVYDYLCMKYDQVCALPDEVEARITPVESPGVHGGTIAGDVTVTTKGSDLYDSDHHD